MTCGSALLDSVKTIREPPLHFIQSTGLLEEMRRSRDDDQHRLRAEQSERRAVELASKRPASLRSRKYLGLMSAVILVFNVLVDRSSILSLTVPQVPYGILRECDSVLCVVCRCPKKAGPREIRLSKPNRPDPWPVRGEETVFRQAKYRSDKRGKSLQFLPVIGAIHRIQIAAYADQISRRQLFHCKAIETEGGQSAIEWNSGRDSAIVQRVYSGAVPLRV